MKFGSGTELRHDNSAHDLRCLVCEEVDAAKHYGSVCCSGCKGFFRRTVRFHKVYDCPFGKKCVIKKEFRNCCRACRFTKCLKVGLNPLLVHGDRGVTNPEMSARMGKVKRISLPDLPISPNLEGSSAVTTIQPNFKVKREAVDKDFEDEKIISVDTPITTLTLNLPLGHLNFISYSDTSETVQIWKYFGNVEKFIDEFNDAKNSGHLSKDFPIDLNLSVKEAMASPRLICHRTKMNWSPQFVMKGFQLRGAWARSVQAYFDWISFVPEIAKLSEHDKELLTVGRGITSVWILFTHRSAVAQAPGILFTGGCYFPKDKNMWDHIDIETQMAGRRLSDLAHSEVIDEMKNLNVSFTECALLKLISLFMAVPQMSSEGVSIIQNARRKYMNVLTEYVRASHPDLDAVGVINRVSRLMFLLPVIERVSTLDDDTMGMMAVFNMANMQGSLTYEMHLRKNEGYPKKDNVNTTELTEL